MLYNTKAVRNAAIAQPVERILGKDEVASSNLASSSKKKPRTPTGFRLSSFLCGVAAITETDTETYTGNIYIALRDCAYGKCLSANAYQNKELKPTGESVGLSSFL